MREPTRPPLSPELCLVQSRRGCYRGGTLIATDVYDLTEHKRRLHVDGYRPPVCQRCGGGRLHLHDRPQRVLVDETHTIVITVVRYICAALGCRATWRVLPAFVARHLWRAWATVARTVAGDPHRVAPRPVPARTRRRWNARLQSAARQLILLLGTHDAGDVARVASVAGFESTRRELVGLFTATRVLGTQPLADLAAAIHELEPGIRLM